MRSFELLLAAAVVSCATAAVLVPRMRRPWRVLSALVPFPVLAVHVLTEGARWQMAPLYVAALSLSLASALRLRRNVSAARDRPPSLRSRTLLTVALIPLLAGAIALPFAVPVFELPPPTGPHAIGTATFYWRDETRAEPFTPDPSDRRELMVQVWYPAKERSSPVFAPYVEAVDLSESLRLFGLPPFFADHLPLVRTHGQPDAPTSVGRDRFPVLIFSPGRGGYRQNSTFLLEDLASHGYVVAAIDHPHTVGGVLFPDGRTVRLDARMAGDLYDRTTPSYEFRNDVVYPLLGRDVVFVLDQLEAAGAGVVDTPVKGRLDMARVGVLGSSLGGAAAAEACRIDTRVGAGLALESSMPPGVVDAGLSQPFLWVTRDEESRRAEGWTESAIAETGRTERAAFERRAGHGYLLFIDGMYHSDVSDLPLFLHTGLASRIGLSGPAPVTGTHAAVRAYTRAFFDRHLKDEPAPLLDPEGEPLPGVRLERRR